MLMYAHTHTDKYRRINTNSSFINVLMAVNADDVGRCNMTL